MKRKRSFALVPVGSASAKKRARRVGPLAGIVKRTTGRQRRLRALNNASMGFLGIERKFYDTFLLGANVAAAADATGGEYDPSTTSMISTPTQGDGEQQRDGKQIACLFVEICGALSIAQVEASVDPPPAVTCFISCVLDTQSNAAQMNSEDCFKNLANSAGTAPDCIRNLLFGKRFRILKQRRFEFNSTTLTQQAANDYSWAGRRHDFKWYIPLKGLKINFNAGTTASIANVIDNSIHIIAFANTVTPQVVLSYNARLRFVG